MEINTLKEKILNNEAISKEEAMSLTEADLDELCEAADEIREKLCGASFDTCTILNGKSGRCGEDCKYCAQSAHHCTGIEEYPLLTADEITESRLANARLGVKRFSVVTSGLRLSDSEVDILCDAYSRLKKQTELELCTSNGLLTYEQFVRLRRAGVSTVHNNLETSRRYFPSICTTHTYEDKINTINAAKRAGMNICSGGIIGIGENVEDRIDLAFELCALGVKSIPINVLIATKGTALENLPPLSDEEVIRTAAIFRFINPKAYIRLAGGRKLLSDNGRKAFRSGLNASLVGNMLTSVGSSIDEDFKMIDELGFKM